MILDYNLPHNTPNSGNMGRQREAKSAAPASFNNTTWRSDKELQSHPNLKFRPPERAEQAKT